MPAFPQKTIRTKNSARVYYLRIVQPDLAHTAKIKNKIQQKSKTKHSKKQKYIV